MRSSALAWATVVVGAASLPATAVAQSAAGGVESKLGDATFYFAQKAWFAKWDSVVIDTQIVPPSAASPAPLLKLSNRHIQMDETVPLTSFGARIGPWSLAATVGWSTDFSDAKVAGGSMSRSEYDVNLGYAVTPNVTLALLYKGGKNDVRGVAGSAAPEAVAFSQTLKGWGAGITATAPLAERLSGYATLAYGTGHSSVSLVDQRLPVKYATAELGLAYRIPDFLGGRTSIQAGYRRQDVRINQVLPTYALTPAPVEVSSTMSRVTSKTQGFVIGGAISF